MKRTTLAVMMTVALAGTSVAANANDWKDGAKDAWIDGKAETTLLLNGNLNSFDINTDVKNGKVTLTGKVDREVDKALAAELVENLDGVSSVDNKLTVSNEKHMRNKKDHDDDGSGLTDAKVATVVKTRLLFESETSGTGIDVEVENGVVMLKGEVDSDAEKDLAEAIAKKTNDVKRVDNQLTVAKKNY
ncbi:Osmotically-inducible protein OsmY, contains BON domain [Arsukibacterium tuosuense]|uniref:Osmotically-inducible protein OsmY, contains BON domain n=1 Tax=Arsukibacterium tuosuense TaxID=1323745 RepID=A0A285J354_9GAMM|nr:BON domain-containing protein [Arsukibacterium tuosuense]SNY54704.1 Osmotically-inducible protein OsmY, contains BON domain [Arsukibacterium tuosuense]